MLFISLGRSRGIVLDPAGPAASRNIAPREGLASRPAALPTNAIGAEDAIDVVAWVDGSDESIAASGAAISPIWAEITSPNGWPAKSGAFGQRRDPLLPPLDPQPRTMDPYHLASDR
ncbi:MAG TPA: hypothetical protein VI074_05845 [Propionibacteriaceae bacterium]